MKNDFQPATLPPVASGVYSHLFQMLWQFNFQAVCVQPICPSLLYCAAIVIELKKTYFLKLKSWDWYAKSFTSFKALWALSFMRDAQTCDIILKTCSFRLLPVFFWHNCWFWTECWRRPAISRNDRRRNPKWRSSAHHVCLTTLAKVNQTHGLQYMKEGRRDPHSHQTRMNNSASVSEFWKETTRIYYSVSVSLDRITSQPSYNQHSLTLTCCWEVQKCEFTALCFA